MPSILITGAGRGLGLELARQYAADGWEVAGTVRGAKGAAALAAVGGRAHELDVTDFAAVKALAARLKDRPLDIVFCNAGIAGKRGVAPGSFDYASWEEVLRVNLLGAAAVAEAFAEHVAASKRKLIAFMSSRLGSIAETSGHTLPYSTSKAALNLLARGLAKTLEPRGIAVVALSPGWVRTDMGGAGAALSPEASVEGLRKVLATLDLKRSGSFLSHDGSPIAW